MPDDQGASKKLLVYLLDNDIWSKMAHTGGGSCTHYVKPEDAERLRAFLLAEGLVEVEDPEVRD